MYHRECTYTKQFEDVRVQYFVKASESVHTESLLCTKYRNDFNFLNFLENYPV